jgi:hypothetical protein
MSWKIGEKYIKQLNQIKTDLPEFAKKSVNTNQTQIVLYYQTNQIGMGLMRSIFSGKLIMTRGVKYRGRYSKTTQDYARYSEPAPLMDKDVGFQYNFVWTGSFFEKMRVNFIDNKSNSKYEIISTDSKAKKGGLLELEFGDILTFADEIAKDVEKLYIAPNFNKELEKRLSAIV